MKPVGRIDGFMKTTCPRCHRESLGVCKQCRAIATLIVESCGMNLSLLPPEALDDADSAQEIIDAVKAARSAFFDSGISAASVKKLHQKIEDGVRAEVDASNNVKLDS